MTDTAIEGQAARAQDRRLMTGVQLDLFADLADRRLAAWRSIFERPVIRWPQDERGYRAGELFRVWRCPDCHTIELHPFDLGLNHGWRPDHVGGTPVAAGRCRAMVRAALGSDYDAHLLACLAPKRERTVIPDHEAEGLVRDFEYRTGVFGGRVRD